MWRCLSGATPTSVALRRRSIEVDPMCRRCGEKEETVEHALRDCLWAVFLWSISPLRLEPILKGTLCSISPWFQSIQSCPQRETHAMFATVLWSIWFARNLLVFQQKAMTHLDCLNVANRARWTSQPCAFSPSPVASTLMCSRSGQVKFSCDAAIEEGRGMGMGVVKRDANGSLLDCTFGFVPGAFSAIEGEAFVVLEAIKWC
ncbi:uncharacterized protein LOC131005848 [Salvia miltiorrhiza]|uniref:uncharacterized protein LOC131005848 n=1 Tax=Salvia miltiorrhiza TaxID=226208 RepID=UPI0025ABF9E7|nr:uncharacterized protein LOC131005848 [Salvia miltiorrhiza]